MSYQLHKIVFSENDGAIILKCSYIQGHILISLTLCYVFHRIREQGNGVKLHQKSNATWPGGVPILGFQLQTSVVTILTLNKVHACKPLKDVEKKMWLLTSFSSLAALFYVSLIQNPGLHLRQAAFLTLSCICSALHL